MLEGLRLACELLTLDEPSVKHPLNPWENANKSSLSELSFTVDGTWERSVGGYEIWLRVDGKRRCSVTEWLADKHQTRGWVLAKSGWSRSGDGGAPFSAHPPRPRVVRLDPEKLAEPSFLGSGDGDVGDDGSRMAAVLADLAVTDRLRFDTIVSGLCNVVPSVKGIRFERESMSETAYERSPLHPELFYDRVTRSVGYRLLVDTTGGTGIDAKHVSFGTLVTLALLTILSTTKGPTLLMIDELERGLHPRALATLISQLRTLTSARPELQLIATTHSPYLADQFKPDEIVLTTLADDGNVVAGSLKDHPEFERWKNEMAPGEFWSTFGEDWLAKRSATT